MPQVTIITPCYNSRRHIAETIASVQAQTFADWEYLLIDDGSTDDTCSLLTHLASQDQRLRLITQKNGGKAATCNRGLHEARGEYIAVLDHDDLYKPEKLARQVAYLEAHPHAGMVYCNTDAIDGQGNLLPFEESQRFQQRYLVGPDGRRQKVDDSDVHLFQYLVVADCIPMLTHLMRRSAALDIGDFDAACWPSDDWDYWIRFSRRYEIHKLDAVLTSYRWHESNFSRDDDRMAHARHTVYEKTRNETTLTPLERKQLNDAIRADLFEHADCCVRWGQSALRQKQWSQTGRYFLRAARLHARLMLPS